MRTALVVGMAASITIAVAAVAGCASKPEDAPNGPDYAAQL
jgi:hypothetical protein